MRIKKANGTWFVIAHSGLLGDIPLLRQFNSFDEARIFVWNCLKFECWLG